MRRRRVESALPPFHRTAEEWQAMGAPAFMWDDVVALRVARSVFAPGARLDGPEWDRCRSRVERLTVWRFRRDVAGAVLARRGQLSVVERDRLERCPPFVPPRVAPKTWRAGLSVAEVAAGRGRG